MDPRAAARREEPVVRRIVPRQDLGRHGVLVQRAHELERLAHLLAVVRDRLAVLGHLGGAVRPHDRPPGRTGVIVVREPDPDRESLGLQLHPTLVHLLPGVRAVRHPDLRPEVLPVEARKVDEEIG